MINFDEWSFLWENPNDYIIVMNINIPPHDPEMGVIFEKRTRYFLKVGNDSLLRLLVQRMRQAGVQSVESQDFHPELTDARKLIDEGLAAGVPREEINRRLRELDKQLNPFGRNSGTGRDGANS
jgi:hypothetical protein